ncbi:hypothetical protein NKH77_35805 [Streptomyces sp. M19]
MTERWISHRPAERGEAERLVVVAKGWITWRAREITIESRSAAGPWAVPGERAGGVPRERGRGDQRRGRQPGDLVHGGAEMIFGHPLAPEPEYGRPPAWRTRPTPCSAAGRRRRRAPLAPHRPARPAARGDRGALGRWNNASAAALELVEAYAVGQAADAFADACSHVTDPADRAVLAGLLPPFPLGQVEARGGLLLTGKALTAGQVRALPGGCGRCRAGAGAAGRCGRRRRCGRCPRNRGG